MEYAEDSDQDINEWQLIQHPFSDQTSPTMHQASGGRNNVVRISENYLPRDRASILPPPVRHEPLQIVPADPEDGSPSSSSSCVSDDDVISMPSPRSSGLRPRVENEGRRLLKVRFEAIRDGVVRVAYKIRDYAICAGAFWSITCVTGVMASMALLIYVGIQRRRRRRKIRQERMDRLACVLKEKDEKIGQLLLQIAHLNEVLSSRRKVPVLRISG
ncbi:putative transmembrane protein [Senna tora]|uniref:Putative transmembrane protein n=1 Tax=Senna tora TaxID=362788 RepID=A0A834SUQ5_9FABA|nr:putative transmembrane protein [Senna tora]